MNPFTLVAFATTLLFLSACGSSTDTSAPEPNANNSPIFTSVNNASTVENRAGIVYTAEATDADGDAIAFSLSGTDESAFDLDASSGELSFVDTPNFESPEDADSNNNYQVIVAADDGQGGIAELSLTVTVEDDNDVPNIVSSTSTVEVAENTSTTFHTFVANDEDGDVLTYSLTGSVDDSLFVIDSASGELSFNTSPNFEAPSDTDSDNNYQVTVTADDSQGGVAGFSLTVTVEDDNDVPNIVSSTSTVEVAENTSTTFHTFVANDEDGDALTYSLTGSVDDSLFAIDSASGELSFVEAPNFESPDDSDSDNSYQIQLQVTDTSSAADVLSFIISVTDVAEHIDFTSDSSITVAENSTGTILTVVAEDDDSDPVTYSLIGSQDDALFSIGDSSGELSFVEAPNFESPDDSDSDNSYSILVSASDGNGNSDSQVITIQVTDANDAPVITSATSGDGSENQTSTNYIATATDEDGDALTFGVSGTDASRFVIDESTGVLSFASAPDYETDPSFDISITATDINLAQATQSVTINVVDESQLSLVITYPTPNANLGYGASQTTVRGYLVDEEDGEVLNSDVVDLDVNATPGALDSDNGDWSASNVTVSGTSNTLTATVEMVGGNLDSVSQTLIADVNLDSLSAMAFDAANNRAIIVNSTDGAVVAVNLADGSSNIVSTPQQSGIAFGRPNDLALNTSGTLAWVTDSELDAIVEIDLLTGDRVILSDNSISDTSGHTYFSPSGIAYDSDADQLLVADTDSGSDDVIVAVNLTDGTRTVTDLGTNAQSNTSALSRLVYISASQLIALDSTDASIGIYEIDLSSGGTVTEIGATGDSGNGELITLTTGMTYDGSNTLYVTENDVDDGFVGVISVDLTTYTRTAISNSVSGGFELGVGDAFDAPSAVVFDGTGVTVASLDTPSVLSVALDTGDRTLVTQFSFGVGEGSSMVEPANAVFDEENNLVYVSDYAANAVFSIDLTTGDRNLITGNGTGSGTELAQPIGIEINDAKDTLYVVGEGSTSVFSVTIADGTRTEVSNSASTGAVLVKPSGVALVDSSTLYVTDTDLPGLVQINLSDGSQSTLLDGTVLSSPTDLVRDTLNSRVLILDTGSNRLIEYTDSGVTTTLSENDDVVGTGQNFATPYAIQYNSGSDTAYVIDFDLPALLAVDLASGNRSVVTDDSTSSILNFDSVRGLALDAANQRAFVTRSETGELFTLDIPSGEYSLTSQ